MIPKTLFPLELKSGPKIEPWGTPLIIGADDEENLPSSTEKDAQYNKYKCK